MSEVEKVNEPTSKELIKGLYDQFKADLPADAYSVDSSRGFDLTSIKAQFLVERLNEVLGFSNWRLDGKCEEKGEGKNGVLFQGHLLIFLGDLGVKLDDGTGAVHQVPTIGYSGSKKNIGDMYKGARTDALSKACSYLGIGNEVFKGNVNPASIKNAAKKPTPAKKAPASAAKPATFQGKETKKASDF